ncbi:hypothetical protein PAJ_0071 [Pantoea ananatis AJ13355]|uniref:Uncharacterized protein n=1 Tax=Pantoea ananatis (strain AJ13355) TaxID=932677 RepID=A0A0H3KSK3_PANAA|nr:hypothetical protein PAJ_0071 [Pantoea ananatis AJ13355]
MRFLPSKLKGLVTTATVKIPRSLATSATTGAAPVPVPPPIPAAMNTMSAPSSAERSASRSSSAELRPTSGFAPAPSPLVMLLPIWMVWPTAVLRNACASVFTAKNSTPSIRSRTMCSTALPPPPPTPMTLITASLVNSIGSNMISLRYVPVAWRSLKKTA